MVGCASGLILGCKCLKIMAPHVGLEPILRLPIRRTAGDRIGEASTLNNIGLTYAGQSDQQKALEYFQQSLAIKGTQRMAVRTCRLPFASGSAIRAAVGRAKH